MRYSYNQSGYGNRMTMFPPVIKWLLIANIVVFVLGLVPMGMSSSGNQLVLGDWFTRFGALWPLGSDFYMPWQYFTYMFLHGGFGHIFFNMLVLWMFGLELEGMWGSKRFLAYYILCGLGAGIIHSIVTLWVGVPAPTVGASGAIMGLLIAYGTLFPNRMILFFFFLPMRVKYAIAIFILLDLFNGIANTNDGIAHFAHLGGALVGYILVRIGGKTTLDGIFKRFGRPGSPGRQVEQTPYGQPTPGSAPSRGRVIDVQFRDRTERSPRNAPPTMDFGNDQQRIDGILDKITQQGYQSLTDEEKAILVEASKKLQ